MSSHAAQMPAVVARYFWPTDESGRLDQAGPTSPTYIRSIPAYPIVDQVFTPGAGWTPYPIRKRVSGNWVNQLRRQGVTGVALRVGTRVADFTMAELTTRSAR